MLVFESYIKRNTRTGRSCIMTTIFNNCSGLVSVYSVSSVFFNTHRTFTQVRSTCKDVTTLLIFSAIEKRTKITWVLFTLAAYFNEVVYMLHTHTHTDVCMSNSVL